ncbi:Dual specificity protein phosphatase 8 [Liparis tanakae]|uniref:Dual specificity protein phosphatase 8 n=1 Tax=Liparis tanakae TaxID=230148 RepID=A0A4Z2H222_9TELE|nr:Dual specificity protein phosphatase 8 [Liparis tanakae]
MAGEKGPTKRSAMDIKRLASLIQRGTGRLLVIDSRTFSEYNASHVQGAVNVCCSKLVKRRLQQDKVSVTELLQPNGKVKVPAHPAEGFLSETLHPRHLNTFANRLCRVPPWFRISLRCASSSLLTVSGVIFVGLAYRTDSRPSGPTDGPEVSLAAAGLGKGPDGGQTYTENTAAFLVTKNPVVVFAQSRICHVFTLWHPLFTCSVPASERPGQLRGSRDAVALQREESSVVLLQSDRSTLSRSEAGSYWIGATRSRTSEADRGPSKSPAWPTAQALRPQLKPHHSVYGCVCMSSHETRTAMEGWWPR